MKARAPHGGAALVIALGVLASGCSPRTETSVRDAGAALDSPRLRLDAPRSDAPDARDAPLDTPPFDAYDPRQCVTLEPGTLLSPCRSDDTCDPGLTCGVGEAASIVPFGSVPTGSIETLVLGAGFCTTRCDPDAREPCACGICVTSWPVGTGRISIADAAGRGVCVQPCFPDVRGGPLECSGPFVCDPQSGGCIPPCTTDDDCLYTSIPGRSDGPRFRRLADKPPLPITCALLRGECTRREPRRSPAIGEACTSDTECALGHVCWASAPGAPSTCAMLADCRERGCGPSLSCVAVDASVTACARLAP